MLAASPGFLWGHWGAIGVERLLADGAPDPTFGNAGEASLYPATGSYFNGGSLALVADPDGSAVTVVEMPGEVPKLSLFGFLDSASRAAILHLAQPEA